MLQKKLSIRSPFTLTRRKTTVVLPPLSNNDLNEEYQPKTLHKYNQERRHFLPTFPPSSSSSSSSINPPPFLFANILPCQLTPMELARRSSTTTSTVLLQSDINDPMPIPSYLHYLYKHLFHDLTKRLRLDVNILDYNLYRLHHMIHYFMSKYRSYYRSTLLYDHHFQLSLQEQHLQMLNQNELLILLEFFLQMDVDLFFMKTRTFSPCLENIHPLFRTDDLTDELMELGYNMEPCHHLYCPLCSSSSFPTVSYTKTNQKHRFCNGYEAILNCPATCQTSNMIYVFTCLCGTYDYIGSTHLTLNEILKYHRTHLHRIMMETLIYGQPNDDVCTCHAVDRSDQQRANKMRLYQHFPRCSIALEAFLKHNPHYWCFIPMETHDAHFDDLSYTVERSSQRSIISMEDKQQTTLDQIPSPPPPGYLFSQRQQQQQRDFFQTRTHVHDSLDLYHATIVAVLPEQSSIMLRQMMEILFVTHAETKLNDMNLLSNDTPPLNDVPYDKNRVWCANLNHPTMSHASFPHYS